MESIFYPGRGAYIQTIKEMTPDELWIEIYGCPLMNPESGNTIYKILNAEINALSEIIYRYGKLTITKSYSEHISDFLHLITKNMCRFEERLFPSEWEVPETVMCRQHPFTKEESEGRRKVIVDFKTCQIKILETSNSSYIGSNLRNYLENDTEYSTFHNSNRFYRKFLSAAVESLCTYNINWIITDDMAPFMAENRSMSVENEPPKKRMRTESDIKMSTDLIVKFIRELQPAGLEEIKTTLHDLSPFLNRVNQVRPARRISDGPSDSFDDDEQTTEAKKETEGKEEKREMEEKKEMEEMEEMEEVEEMKEIEEMAKMEEKKEIEEIEEKKEMEQTTEAQKETEDIEEIEKMEETTEVLDYYDPLPPKTKTLMIEEDDDDDDAFDFFPVEIGPPRTAEKLREERLKAKRDSEERIGFPEQSGAEPNNNNNENAENLNGANIVEDEPNKAEEVDKKEEETVREVVKNNTEVHKVPGDVLGALSAIRGAYSFDDSSSDSGESPNHSERSAESALQLLQREYQDSDEESENDGLEEGEIPDSEDDQEDVNDGEQKEILVDSSTNTASESPEDTIDVSFSSPDSLDSATAIVQVVECPQKKFLGFRIRNLRMEKLVKTVQQDDVEDVVLQRLSRHYHSTSRPYFTASDKTDLRDIMFGHLLDEWRNDRVNKRYLSRINTSLSQVLENRNEMLAAGDIQRIADGLFANITDRPIKMKEVRTFVRSILKSYFFIDNFSGLKVFVPTEFRVFRPENGTEVPIIEDKKNLLSKLLKTCSRNDGDFLKTRIWAFCRALMDDIVRAVFIVQRNEDGALEFFYNGLFDIPTVNPM